MRTKIDPATALYKRALRREGKFWQGQTDDPVHATHLPRALVQYRRACETGDEQKDRFTYLKELGPFKRGLSIGCGSANVELELLKRNIVEEFTFIDISEESLKRLLESAPKKLRDRIRILRQDLNFIDLEEEQYDFIFCANVLHHIINLEHVLLEMNKALTKDGILYIDDFVGEARFQFSQKRIAKINQLAQQVHNKIGISYTPLGRTARKTLINSCPFEAIRSDDLLPLLHELFKKTTVREEGHSALLWIDHVLNFNVQSEKERAQLEHAVEFFIAEDKKVKRSKSLPPLFIFAAYKKNLHPPKWQTQKWTKQELKTHLPVSVFDEGILYRVGERLRRILGEGVIYRSLKRAYLAMRR